MGSRAPGGGGCAHPRERCTPLPPPQYWRRGSSCLGKEEDPPPPILPRGLSGPPRPAEDVIKGRVPRTEMKEERGREEGVRSLPPPAHPAPPAPGRVARHVLKRHLKSFDLVSPPMPRHENCESECMY